jgi:redox-sensitive bicupin YhaK (pirin superfamily)
MTGISLLEKDKLNTFCNITEKLPIKQDARLLAGIFTQDFDYQLDITRKYYLYVVKGSTILNGINLIEGDGLSFVDDSNISLINSVDCEIIMFDLSP